MEKGQPFQRMVLVQLAVSMQKNANRPILIFLCKAQVQLDQRPAPKTRYTECVMRESEEEHRTHRHRGENSQKEHKWLMLQDLESVNET